MQRLRIKFAKTSAMKYTGHLDLHLAWERTFRRARLPLAYSQGFHPQPRIQIAAALPLGFTSECELVDVWLEAPQDPAEARLALAQTMPPGLSALEVTEVPEHGPALQTQIRSAIYRVLVPERVSTEILDERIAALLAAPEIRRERRGRPYDLRLLIENLVRGSADDRGHTLLMQLAAREGATGRPEEVVEALGLPSAEARYHRLRLVLADGAAPRS
jgi:radical SAM-linked protein